MLYIKLLLSMIKEIRLSSLNDIVQKQHKKEPPRSIKNDLTHLFLLVCV